MRFVVHGDPKPKERPRVNHHSGVVYTPRSTKKHEELIGWHALSCGEKFGNKEVVLSAWFYCKNKKKIDGDNLIKLVSDALQAADIFTNDNQIVDWHSYVREDKNEPRTEVEVVSAVPSRPCIYCGFPANTGQEEGKVTCNSHHDLIGLDVRT